MKTSWKGREWKGCRLQPRVTKAPSMGIDCAGALPADLSRCTALSRLHHTHHTRRTRHTRHTRRARHTHNTHHTHHTHRTRHTHHTLRTRHTRRDLDRLSSSSSILGSTSTSRIGRQRGVSRQRGFSTAEDARLGWEATVQSPCRPAVLLPCCPAVLLPCRATVQLRY
jgi:hypothetical protein